MTRYFKTVESAWEWRRNLSEDAARPYLWAVRQSPTNGKYYTPIRPKNPPKVKKPRDERGEFKW